MTRRVFLRRRRSRKRQAHLARLRLVLEAAARVTAPHFMVPTEIVLQPAGHRRPPNAEALARRLAYYIAHTSGQVPMKALSEITGHPYRGKRGVSDIMRRMEDARDDLDFDALVTRLEENFQAELGGAGALS
ncbi:MAG: hypothetical protein CMF75_08375 [Maricaulis sp.]|nr:hypothetical protein [Maricaulis sp.]